MASGGGDAHDRAPCRPAAAGHAGQRQGLRQRRLRQCGAEHHQPTLGNRRPHDASSGLCDQPPHPQAPSRRFGCDQGSSPVRRRRRVGRPRASTSPFPCAATAYNLARLLKLLREARGDEASCPSRMTLPAAGVSPGQARGPRGTPGKMTSSTWPRKRTNGEEVGHDSGKRVNGCEIRAPVDIEACR